MADDTEMTLLHHAATTGHEGMVRILLAKGANIESQDDRGRTAFNCAAAEGHVAVLRVLLNKNANVQADDYHGKTALPMQQRTVTSWQLSFC
jgi:ankyrin repeat protein